MCTQCQCGQCANDDDDVSSVSLMCPQCQCSNDDYDVSSVSLMCSQCHCANDDDMPSVSVSS